MVRHLVEFAHPGLCGGGPVRTNWQCHGRKTLSFFFRGDKRLAGRLVSSVGAAEAEVVSVLMLSSESARLRTWWLWRWHGKGVDADLDCCSESVNRGRTWRARLPSSEGDWVASLSGAGISEH